MKRYSLNVLFFSFLSHKSHFFSHLDFSFSYCRFRLSLIFTFDLFLVFLILGFLSCYVGLYDLVKFYFLVLFISSIFAACFFVCVKLSIKRLSLVVLSYQPSFDPRNISYVVYELTICHNQSYFDTFFLDHIIPTKQTKNKLP